MFLFWKIVSQIELRPYRTLAYGLSGNYMTLFLLVKPSNAFDRHVVGFRRARSENDVFGVGTDEIGNILFKSRYAEISN